MRHANSHVVVNEIIVTFKAGLFKNVNVSSFKKKNTVLYIEFVSLFLYLLFNMI